MMRYFVVRPQRYACEFAEKLVLSFSKEEKLADPSKYRVVRCAQSPG
jgi:hypothetical protein